MYGSDGVNSLRSSYVKCLVQNLALPLSAQYKERLCCGRQRHQVGQAGPLEPPPLPAHWPGTTGFSLSAAAFPYPKTRILLVLKRVSIQ